MYPRGILRVNYPVEIKQGIIFLFFFFIVHILHLDNCGHTDHSTTRIPGSCEVVGLIAAPMYHLLVHTLAILLHDQFIVLLYDIKSDMFTVNTFIEY